MHRLPHRLTLRRPMASDLERLFALYGDPATHPFNPFGPLLELDQARVLLDKWTHHHHRPFSGYSTATRTWSVSSSAWAALPRCWLYWSERRVPFAAPLGTT